MDEITKVKEMWDTYRKLIVQQTPDNEQEVIKAKNNLLVYYYPVVEKVAKRLHKKLKEVQEDDLVSWGVDGLYDAVEGFDEGRGIKFETYAMHRIRGAILDHIRKIDWIPRLVRQRSTKLEKMKQRMEAEAGRTLSSSEMAEKLNLSLEEFEEQIKQATPIGCVSISSKTDESTGETIEINNLISRDKSPVNNILRKELLQKLLNSNFTKLEKKIMYLHYMEGYTMKEISQLTGYSESRISQMHAEILVRLQKKIDRNPDYASDIMCIFST